MAFLILLHFVSIATANYDLYNTFPSNLMNIYHSNAQSIPMILRPIYPPNNFRLYEPYFNTPPPQPPQNDLINLLLQKRMLKKFSDNILDESDADLQKKYLNQLVWMMRSGMFKPNNGLSTMFPMMQMDLFGEDNDINGLLPLLQMGLLGQNNLMGNLPSEYYSESENHYHAPSFSNAPRAIYPSEEYQYSFSPPPTQPPQDELFNQFLQQRMLTKFSDNILSQSDEDLQKKHLDQLIWMMRTGMFKSDNGINSILPMMQMDLFGEDSEMSNLFPLMQMGLFGQGNGMNLLGLL